jgi:hypothetical protein
MKNKVSLVIRCGSPDCNWGFPMRDLEELAFKTCYSSFRQHCAEVHGGPGQRSGLLDAPRLGTVDADATEAEWRLGTPLNLMFQERGML